MQASSVEESVTSSVGDFVIQLVRNDFTISTISLSPSYTDDITLTVYSNGSASYDWWSNYTDPPGPRLGESRRGVFPTSQISELRDILIDEGFPDLQSRYYDDYYEHWTRGTSQREIRLIDSGGAITSSVFEWNSAYGIIPRSSTTLDNFVWALRVGESQLPNVSAELALLDQGEGIFMADAYIVNAENRTSYSNWSGLPWDVKIVYSNGTTAYPGCPGRILTWGDTIIPANSTIPLNYYFLEQFNFTEFGQGEAVFVSFIPLSYGGSGGNIPFSNFSMMEIRGDVAYLTTDSRSRPLELGPFSVSPMSGTVGTAFAFNASGVDWDGTPIFNGSFRWDWDDDGAWDTDWSNSTTAEHGYSAPGTYVVRLAAENSEGVVRTSMQVVVVSAVPVPNVGPLTATLFTVISMLVVLRLLRGTKPHNDA